MLKIIITIHIILSLLLITFILINKGKGADTGGITNTSTNDVFGSKGSSSILNKIIILIAVMSLISNISINLINKDIKKKDLNPTIDLYQYETISKDKTQE